MAETIGEALAQAAERLAAAGVEEPRREARVLLRLILGAAPARELDHLAPLAEPEATRLAQLVARRSRHEPVAYLRGSAEFRSLVLEVSPAVLIPRSETELLVEVGLAFLAGCPGPRVRVVDMGTGSGAVAVAVALAEPRAVLHAVDCSHPALMVAERNAARHGVSDRVRCLHGSFWSARLPATLRGHAEAVLCNPPYVDPEDYQGLPPEVRDWEPGVALVAEQGHRRIFQEIAAGGLPWLAPGGLLACEVGAGQAAGVSELLASSGYVGIEVRRDYAGIERVVSGVKPR